MLSVCEAELCRKGINTAAFLAVSEDFKSGAALSNHDVSNHGFSNHNFSKQRARSGIKTEPRLLIGTSLSELANRDLLFAASDEIDWYSLSVLLARFFLKAQAEFTSTDTSIKRERD